jgi:hypothetical protein
MPGFTSTALTDLDMWARGVPYDEFARLRRECPVAWFEEDAPNSGYWSVHRHQDIVTASRDVATFSSARGVSFEEPTDADMAADRFAMIWCGVLTLDRLGPYDPAYGRIRASRIQGPAAAGRDSAIRRVHGSGVLIGLRAPVAEGGLDGTGRPRQDHRVRLGFFT